MHEIFIRISVKIESIESLIYFTVTLPSLHKVNAKQPGIDNRIVIFS